MGRDTSNSIWKSFLTAIAIRLNEKIWLKIGMQAFPILWTTVITPSFRTTFYTENGNLNLWGIIIAIVSAALSIIVMVITSIQNKEDLQMIEDKGKKINQYSSELVLRQRITSAENAAEDRRNRRLQRWLASNPSPESIRQLVDGARNPEECISTILDEIAGCLNQVSEIPPENIYVSAAISRVKVGSPPTQKRSVGVWAWLYNPRTMGTASLADLLTSSKSSFRKVVDGLPFYFANDKKEAGKKGEYIFDGMDDSYNHEGSIICYEVSETINNNLIRLIISISTYGRKLIEQQKKDTDDQVKRAYEDSVRGIILNQFEGELKEDLLWYYLRDNVKKTSSKK